eukprot:gene7828-663_t
MGGTDRGLGFKDALSTLAILLENSHELRARFIFNLYDREDKGFLTQSSFQQFNQSSDSIIPEPFRDYFSKTPQLNFSDFFEIASRDSNCCTLIAWIFFEPRISSPFIPTYHETLTTISTFDVTTVQQLEARYHNLRPMKPGSKFDVAHWVKRTCPPLTPRFAMRLFSAFDTDGDGDISLKELLEGLSRSCNTDDDRIALCKYQIIRMYVTGDDTCTMNPIKLGKLLHEFSDLAHPESFVSRPTVALVTDAVHLAAMSAHPSRLSSCTVDEFDDGCSSSSQDTPDVFGREDQATLKAVHEETSEQIEQEDDEPSQPHRKTSSSCNVAKSPLPDSWAIQAEKLLSTKEIVDLQAGFTATEFLKWFTNSKHAQTFSLALKQILHLVLLAKPCSADIEGTLLQHRLSLDKKLGFPNIEGATCYLINAQWFSSWLVRVGIRPDFSGIVAPDLSQTTSQKIDNSHLCDRNAPLSAGPLLRKDVREGQDYVLVSEPVWNALVTWHGGGPCIPRPVCRFPDGTITPEIFPLVLRIMKHQPQSTNFLSKLFGHITNNTDIQKESKPIQITPFFQIDCSRTATVQDLLKRICRRQRIEPGGFKSIFPQDARLWDYRCSSKPVLLAEDNASLMSLGFADKDPILLEVRNADLSWPSELLAVAKANEKIHASDAMVDVNLNTNTNPAKALYSPKLPLHALSNTPIILEAPSNTAQLEQSESISPEQQESTEVLGCVGLSNLGNTCFLNSAVQCLVHASPLTEYFIKHRHLLELNRTNPLGHQGTIAIEYGRLVRRLWRSSGCVAPVKLRNVIQKFAPHFAGYQQHDSQEFLSFLLDGLHEDLNRVKTKPYVERQDSNGRPDHVVAREAWDGHLLRNKSVIVDIFQGLLKSRLKCNHCQTTSVAFDPFSFLSLPLPTEGKSSVEIKLYPLDGSVPTVYCVSIEPDQTYDALRDKLAQLARCPVESLTFLECDGARISQVLQMGFKYKPLIGRHLIAFEIDPRAVADTAPTNVDATHQGPCSGVKAGVDRQALVLQPITDRKTESQQLQQQQQQLHKQLPKHSKLPEPLQQVYQERQKYHINSSRSFVSGTPTRPAPPQRQVWGHLACAFRRYLRLEPNLLASCHTSRLFGHPLLIPHYKNQMRNIDLYEEVWSRISRFFHQSFRTAMAPNTYPFTLRKVARASPRWCCLCPWYKKCEGCPIPQSKELLNHVNLSLIAIDCTPEDLHLYYLPNQEYAVNYVRVLLLHSSVEEERKRVEKPVTLDDCFKAFTKEEQLEGDWYCSNCKEHRSAKKKLDIWTLPPCLIIHLKRFQMHNGRWIKSNSRVKFPVTDFHPYKFSAHISNGANEPIAKPCNSRQIFNIDTDEHASMQIEKCNEKEEFSSVESGDHGDKPCDNDKKLFTNAQEELPNGSSSDNVSDEIVPHKHESILQLSTSASKEESMTDEQNQVDQVCTSEEDIDFSAIDPHLEFYTEETTGRVYELYAVSCHLGILGGGHYVSYTQGTDKRWYLLNDSSCKLVSAQDVRRQAGNAYMLFYQCKGLDTTKILPAGGEVNEAEVEFLDKQEEEQSKETTCAIM